MENGVKSVQWQRQLKDDKDQQSTNASEVIGDEFESLKGP